MQSQRPEASQCVPRMACLVGSLAFFLSFPEGTDEASSCRPGLKTFAIEALVSLLVRECVRKRGWQLIGSLVML